MREAVDAEHILRVAAMRKVQERQWIVRGGAFGDCKEWLESVH